MNQAIKVYEPDNSIRKGYISIFFEIVRELRDNRWLTYQLFKRDLFAMHKQSLVGMAWIVIMPIFSVAAFVALKHSGVMSAGEIETPYPLYAILGLTFWQLFSAGLMAAAGSLVQAGLMVKIINFSKKSLVIASMGKAGLTFLIQLVLTCLLFIYYGRTPAMGIWYLPLVFIPLFCLTLGVGFILAILNSIMRDVANVLSIVVTFGMFLTPVLYAKPSSGILAEITRWNPLYYFVSAGRDLLLTGRISEWTGFLWSSLFSFLVFFACFVIFHLTETRITERV